MKKIISAALLIVMIFSLIGCKGKTEEVSKSDNSVKTNENALAPMTKEKITLTYACWGLKEAGETEARDAALKAFTEKYPNITVEFVNIDQGKWAEGLNNLAASNSLPDVFWTFNSYNSVANEWALDITDLYDKDPDSKQIIKDFGKIGVYNGKRYATPTFQFPYIVFLNKTLFDKYNVPMPKYDWTWDQYLDLGKKLSHPQDYYFGFSNPVYVDVLPIINSTDKGQMGFDGTKYNFNQDWIDAYALRNDLIRTKQVEWMSADEKQKVLGAPNAWPPGKGRTAIHIDWTWTINALTKDAAKATGSEFKLYPIPKGKTDRVPSIIDLSCISATTKYPREAYELNKFTSWGAEGYKVRLEAYKSAGITISRLPIIDNKEIWDGLYAQAPDEGYKAIYNSIKHAVPTIDKWAPGHADFQKWMTEQDYVGKMNRGEVNPADIAQQLTQKANEFAAQAIENIK